MSAPATASRAVGGSPGAGGGRHGACLVRVAGGEHDVVAGLRGAGPDGAADVPGPDDRDGGHVDAPSGGPERPLTFCCWQTRIACRCNYGRQLPRGQVGWLIQKQHPSRIACRSDARSAVGDCPAGSRWPRSARRAVSTSATCRRSRTRRPSRPWRPWRRSRLRWTCPPHGCSWTRRRPRASCAKRTGRAWTDPAAPISPRWTPGPHATCACWRRWSRPGPGRASMPTTATSTISSWPGAGG